MNRLRFSNKTVPWMLLAACLVAFGLLIPWLGFYQDDWYQIWFRRAYGTQVYIDYYAFERPFIAGLYLLTTPLVGTTPLAWQIFGLLTRWLAAWAVWWFLRLIWPRHPKQTAWAALLFGLYPGFRIQYAAVIYSHYFLQLGIQLLSLGSMLLALRKPRWFWPLMAFSVGSAVFGLLSSEYFFGLELARPVFLWLALGEEAPRWRARLRRTLACWWPFLVCLAGFLAWRLVIFQFPTYQPIYLQQPETSTLGLAFELAKTIGQDVLEMGLLAWGDPIRRVLDVSGLRPASLAAAGLALVSGLALCLYLLRFDEKPASEMPGDGHARNFASSAIPAGLLLLLASGWPFWFVALNVDTDINGGSRFGIAFMLGSALLLAGLIDLLGRHRLLQAGLVAVLAGLAAGYHFLDADFFREVNRTQASFFQQLAWRAPGLEPGTLVLTNSFEKNVLSGDNSLTAALNWIYEPQPPYSLKYVLFYIPTRIETGDLPSLETGQPFHRRFRTAEFDSSTDHALVLFYPYPNCLRVLDPQAHQDLPRPLDMPREIKAAIQLSNLAQIQTQADPPASLPAALFKYRLDENSWCYYYEKAELARQERDWQTLVKLADQALVGERKYATTWELLPFIEGYARGGQPEKARQLSLETSRLQPEGRATTTQILCSLWDRLARQASLELSPVTSSLRTDLECR